MKFKDSFRFTSAFLSNLIDNLSKKTHCSLKKSDILKYLSNTKKLKINAIAKTVENIMNISLTKN